MPTTLEPMTTQVLVFAKAPQAGYAKTRLIPYLGADGAAALARTMLDHTLQTALTADVGPVTLCMSPAPGDAAWHDVALPAIVQRCAQGSGDLGQRMARAVSKFTPVGAVLLIGTDCPGLTPARLRQAAQALSYHDAVLFGARDGGYVLLGLKRACPALFQNMPWSSASVAGITLQRLAALGLLTWQGPVLHDVDEPADLIHLPTAWLARCAPTAQNVA